MHNLQSIISIHSYKPHIPEIISDISNLIDLKSIFNLKQNDK